MGGKHQEGVAIKGTRDGLTVVIGQGEWEELLGELERQLSATEFFFQGSDVSLEVSGRKLTEEDLKQLQKILERHQVTLKRVVSDVASTRSAARTIGLVARKPVLEEENYALLKRGPIRSGQRVEYPGPVVILGDVNPGAEIVAGGDIIVWGRLRGRAYAGAGGDDSCVICALALEPSLLRIGRYAARPPEGEASASRVPEVAFVQEGRIVVEPWGA